MTLIKVCWVSWLASFLLFTYYFFYTIVILCDLCIVLKLFCLMTLLFCNSVLKGVINKVNLLNGLELMPEGGGPPVGRSTNTLFFYPSIRRQFQWPGGSLLTWRQFQRPGGSLLTWRQFQRPGLQHVLLTLRQFQWQGLLHVIYLEAVSETMITACFYLPALYLPFTDDTEEGTHPQHR